MASNVTYYDVAMDTLLSNTSLTDDDDMATLNVTDDDDVRVASIFDSHSFVSFLQTFCPLASRVDRVVTIIWYIIGVTGNILSAKIWLEKRMRKNNSSAIYLATLSISDLIFLLLHTLQEMEYAWGLQTLDAPVLCEAYFMFIFVVQYLSPILVLAFTCERYIAVCHPFNKEKFCTTSRAIRVVFGLVAGCLLLGSMQAVIWRYDAVTGMCSGRTNISTFWHVWSWSTEILVFLIVPAAILVFNILVIREIKQLSRNSEQMMMPNEPRKTNNSATTLMLLSVSFYVIITVVPATIVYILTYQFPIGSRFMTPEQIRQDPKWQRYFTYVTCRKIIEEICISHYACNFFLYLLTGPQFRKSFCRLIAKLMPEKYRHKFAQETSFTSNNSVGTRKTSLNGKNVYAPVASGRDTTRM